MSDITKIKVDGEPESSYQLYPRNEEFAKRAGGGNGGSNVQPDWNQNDDTQPDYVKNRPFWREKTKELLFPTITEPINITTKDNGHGFFIATGNFDVRPGVTNYVVFDGVEYACEPYYDEAEGKHVIGSFDFSDYPFCIAENTIITKTAGNHTVLQYFDLYTIQTDYVPHLVIRTLNTADRTLYLAMEDVEKIKVAFKNGVPIIINTILHDLGVSMRVNQVTDRFIYTSGFISGNSRVIEQAELIFSVSDGSLYGSKISFLGSIITNGIYYPVMFINNKYYKITVNDSGALTATEVT